MARITIVRTEQPMPILQPILDALRNFLFGVIDGFTRDDKLSWRKLWRRIKEMAPGEMLVIEAVFPRSGPYHRRHMAIEQAVYDAQERFEDFDQFRIWTKVGAGWVDWCAGPKGGVVPVPKSISYAKADQEEFRQYHEAVMRFLRGPHAARFLWRHLENPDEMMNSILEAFEE